MDRDRFSALPTESGFPPGPLEKVIRLGGVAAAVARRLTAEGCRNASERVADLRRTGWPNSIGIGGRIQWNTHESLHGPDDVTDEGEKGHQCPESHLALEDE